MSTEPNELDLLAEIELQHAEEIAAAEGWDAEEQADFDARYSEQPREYKRSYKDERFDSLPPLSEGEVRYEARKHDREVNISRGITLGTGAGVITLSLRPRFMQLWQDSLEANRIQRDAALFIEIMIEPKSEVKNIEQLSWVEFALLSGLVQKRFTQIRLMERHGIAWRSVAAQGVRRYAHGGC